MPRLHIFHLSLSRAYKNMYKGIKMDCFFSLFISVFLTLPLFYPSVSFFQLQKSFGTTKWFLRRMCWTDALMKNILEAKTCFSEETQESCFFNAEQLSGSPAFDFCHIFTPKMCTSCFLCQIKNWMQNFHKLLSQPLFCTSSPSWCGFRNADVTNQSSHTSWKLSDASNMFLTSFLHSAWNAPHIDHLFWKSRDQSEIRTDVWDSWLSDFKSLLSGFYTLTCGVLTDLPSQRWATGTCNQSLCYCSLVRLMA